MAVQRMPVLVFAALAAVVVLALPASARAACPAGSLDTSFMSPSVDDTIAAGETDCYTLADVASGDHVEIRFVPTGALFNPRWAITDGSAATLCQTSSHPGCTLTGAGPWSVRVFDSSAPGTFSYSLAARRTTNPS